MSVYLINHSPLGGSSAPLYSMGWHKQNNAAQSAKEKKKTLLPEACSQRLQYNRATKEDSVSYTALLMCIKSVSIKKCICPAAFNGTLTGDISYKL